MICPKCRKNYPDTTDICPDCEVELIGLLGDADAPSDDDKMERIIIDSDGEAAPTVVYRSIPTETQQQKNAIAIIILIIALIFLAASAFCFILGKGEGSTNAVSAMISALSLILQ